MEKIKDASAVDLLQPPALNNQTWKDLTEAFTELMNINVDGPIEQLETIRYIYKDSDPEMLRKTCRMLGFDVTQDVLSLNAENLTKIVTQLPLYPDQNGTEKFINFIDLLLNSLSEVTYLYTKDYVNFYPEPQGAMIDEGGPWFKTTHIMFSPSMLGLEKLNLGGKTLYARVKELFYAFSPIALVIERMQFVVIFKDFDFLGGSAFGIGAYMPPTELIVTIE